MNFEDVILIVVMGDVFSEFEYVRVNNDMIEEGLGECDRVIVDSFCDVVVLKLVGK